MQSFGPGEGVELSAVGHYTLNKANARGEWMTHWLLENKLVAANTMYQKIPQKHVTYRSPKNDEKQLDYVLLDKKHLTWSRDAESTDILHKGSDHRCVMARFDITAKEVKGQPRQSKAPMEDRLKETNVDEKQQEYLDIEQEVKETELKKDKSEGTAGEATNTSADAATKEGAEAHAAAALDVNIETRQAVATDGPAAQEDKDTNEKDEKNRALIQKRKNTAKHEKEQIREISKEIKKNIRENKRMKRQKRIQKILEKVKGTKTYQASNQ